MLKNRRTNEDSTPNMGDFYDDWTLVQRGRRRNRARQPLKDWVRKPGWMERAFPVPYRGRDSSFPRPNPNPLALALASLIAFATFLHYLTQ